MTEPRVAGQYSIGERVHSFGVDDGLVGVVTLPPGALLGAAERRPFVVLLNAGLVHRVGPFGLGVALARDLAARGFRVLRFDQSGLGDSPARPVQVPIEHQAVVDGRAAMDFLAARYGAERFAIGGLCSGALNAHRICIADPRVVGMWMLDGYAYPTRLYRRHLLVRRIRNPESWRRLGQRIYAEATRRLGRGTARSDRGPELASGDDRRAIYYQDWPEIDDARAEIEQMLARGVRLLFVYTAGWSNFVDARQFDEMFPRLARRHQIEVAYHPRADHTYLALEDRELVVRDVGNFLSKLSN